MASETPEYSSEPSNWRQSTVAQLQSTDPQLQSTDPQLQRRQHAFRRQLAVQAPVKVFFEVVKNPRLNRLVLQILECRIPSHTHRHLDTASISLALTLWLWLLLSITLVLVRYHLTDILPLALVLALAFALFPSLAPTFLCAAARPQCAHARHTIRQVGGRPGRRIQCISGMVQVH